MKSILFALFVLAGTQSFAAEKLNCRLDAEGDNGPMGFVLDYGTMEARVTSNERFLVNLHCKKVRGGSLAHGDERVPVISCIDDRQPHLYTASVVVGGLVPLTAVILTETAGDQSAQVQMYCISPVRR